MINAEAINTVDPGEVDRSMIDVEAIDTQYRGNQCREDQQSTFTFAWRGDHLCWSLGGGGSTINTERINSQLSLLLWKDDCLCWSRGDWRPPRHSAHSTGWPLVSFTVANAVIEIVTGPIRPVEYSCLCFQHVVESPFHKSSLICCWLYYRSQNNNTCMHVVHSQVMCVHVLQSNEQTIKLSGFLVNEALLGLIIRGQWMYNQHPVNQIRQTRAFLRFPKLLSFHSVTVFDPIRFFGHKTIIWKKYNSTKRTCHLYAMFPHLSSNTPPPPAPWTAILKKRL